MKPTSSLRPRLRFSLRLLLVVVAVLAAGCYWVTLPQRTWNEFLLALRDGDVKQINDYCDPRTLHFGESSVSGYDMNIWVSRPDSQKFNRPTSLAEFHNINAGPRSVADWLLGCQKMGHPGSVLFGQIEVRRFHIAFTPD